MNSSQSSSSQPDDITPEFLDELRGRDERIARIELGVDIENELSASKGLKLLIDLCEQQAVSALEKLATVSPSNVNEIISLQAIVYRSRFIRNTLGAVIDRGRAAQQSLIQDTED